METIPMDALTHISSFCINTIKGVSKHFEQAITQYFTSIGLDYAAWKCLEMLRKIPKSNENGRMVYIKFNKSLISYNMLLRLNEAGYTSETLMKLAFNELACVENPKNYDIDEINETVRSVMKHKSISISKLSKYSRRGSDGDQTQKMEFVIQVYNMFMLMCGSPKRLKFDGYKDGYFCSTCHTLSVKDKQCCVFSNYAFSRYFMYRPYESTDQMNWFYMIR